ncbi:MAG: phospholipase D-like domain-containing protein [Kofleriaceae bacterium]
MATSRLARVAKRSWKVVLALVVGIGLGLVLPVGMSLCNSTRPGDPFVLSAEVPPAGSAFDPAFFQTLGARFEGGHAITMLDNGRVFDALIEDIGRARSSIHIAMYIWEAGAASSRVSAALIARAKAGVSCRLLIDAFGSSDFEDTVAPELVRAGCEVRMFRPLPGAAPLSRNHRKMIVIDGAIAMTGGFGVRDNWLGDGVANEGWRDTNVRFTGPAVRDAQQAFAENWQEAGGALLPASTFPEPSRDGSVRAAFVASTAAAVVTRAERLTQLVMAAATRRLWIVNAYFAPSKPILDLIKRKAASGVDVRLLVPGRKSDSKPALAKAHTYYDSLRAAGVQLWEYQPSMIHSKTMLADDQLVVIGTINLDPLSLNKLDDAALVIEDATVASELARAFVADCVHARRL